MARLVALDKGIEIPYRRFNRLKYPWPHMQIGDSFVMEKSNGAHSMAKRFGYRVTVRKEGKGYRVWRIEDEAPVKAARKKK